MFISHAGCWVLAHLLIMYVPTDKVFFLILVCLAVRPYRSCTAAPVTTKTSHINPCPVCLCRAWLIPRRNRAARCLFRLLIYLFIYLSIFKRDGADLILITSYLYHSYSIQSLVEACTASKQCWIQRRHSGTFSVRGKNLKRFKLVFWLRSTLVTLTLP